MTTTVPYTYKITMITDSLVASGTLKTTDSNGVEVDLTFSADLESAFSVDLSLATNSNSYMAYNDRLLPASASDDEVGFVFVVPTYEHNVMTEEQVSKHWWSEEDGEALRKHLLDDLLKRLGNARYESDLVFKKTMMAG